MQREQIAPLALCAAIIAGASYLAAPYVQFNPATAIVWKGAGVALLALYAAIQAKSVNGWLITAVMAFGALGDVLLEAAGLTTGAIAFVVGHVIAIYLYRRNRRISLTPSQWILATLTVPLSLLISLVLIQDLGVAIYTFFVAMMAATAWTSRFPRYRTGIGAMMFLASDLLIFAQMGVLERIGWVSPAIWPLYFGGQVLIAMGVVHNQRPLN
jgi:uncharacterized membrane protein YhhN